MLKPTSILLMLVMSLNVHAEVKPHMDLMLKELLNLKPFIVSDVEYRDPKNFQQISDSLKNMVVLSDKISHEDMINKTGFGPSSQALKQQLKEAELVYRVGNKDYSLWMLRSTLSVCMSCHTQLPASSTQFDSSSKEHFLTKPFEEAEFLFIIRNFDKALPLYDQVIQTYPQVGITQENLEKALARKTYYFVRVKRDLSGLIKSLEKNEKNKNLPDLVKKEIRQLKKAAKLSTKAAFPAFSSTQKSELKKYIESQLKEEMKGTFNLSAERNLTYLRLSSILYKYLEENPNTDLKPDILYWLSFCERRYEQKAFYSLPELYLKQCIQEFPQAQVAKSCLTEYRELVNIAYTGSSGTHIPKEIEKELESMKNLVEGTQKKIEK